MEIDIISKNHSAELKQHYFFNLANEINYEKKMKYFINNNILKKTYSSEYYYNLPFKIFELLFRSFSEKTVRITNSLSVPQKLWNIKYFDNADITNVAQKKNLYIILNYHIVKFLNEFKKEKKLSLSNMEKLTKEMNENFVNKILNHNKNDFDNKNKDIQIMQNKSYMELLKFLIQNCIQMNEVLKLSNLNNFDCNEELNEKVENKIIQNSRIALVQFYSHVILKIIINDLYKVLLYFNKYESKETFNFDKENE